MISPGKHDTGTPGVGDDIRQKCAASGFAQFYALFYTSLNTSPNSLLLSTTTVYGQCKFLGFVLFKLDDLGLRSPTTESVLLNYCYTGAWEPEDKNRKATQNYRCAIAPGQVRTYLRGALQRVAGFLQSGGGEASTGMGSSSTAGAPPWKPS